jgi:DNA-binding transcriptional LysR family regulator
MQSMLWDDVRVFLAVQRTGSHKQAARLLAVDATTVSRRVAALEEALGTRLLLRTPDRLQATRAGELLAERAERMEAEALAGERELSAADARLEGTVRITAADGLLHYVLLPALADFRRLHPAVRVDFIADNRELDLSRREAEVAVRLTRPREPALVARRLGELRMSLFASPEYVERRGAPRNVSALSAHDFIGFDAALDALPQVKWLRRTVREPHYVVRANTTTAQALACAEGHGIALLPVFVGANEPRLRRLMPRLVGPTRELWAVSHVDLRANARVEACISWLARVVSGPREEQ